MSTPTGTVGTVLPTFAWNGLNGVVQYEIYIDDVTAGVIVVDQTVSATGFTPTTPLVSGHGYRWWVRAVNGVWSGATDFTVALPVSTSPTTSVNNVLPTFNWTVITGVQQYEIYVSDLTAGGFVDQTTSAATWTPTTPLISGHSYRWWVRAANSMWSNPTDFAVALPTLVAPGTPVNTSLPTFLWNGLTGVSHYEIYVSDLTAGGFVDQAVSATDWTPTTSLISGHSYRWWVRAESAVWSAPLDFTEN